MKTQCTHMKMIVEQILAKRGKLDEFKTSEDFHIKIKNDPYMPLTIEKHGNRVMVIHYFEQNGDLISDPDQEMMIGADGEWYPVAIQFATGHYSKAREWRDGKEFINPREIVDQVRFSSQWAKNIKNQGFITAGV